MTTVVLAPAGPLETAIGKLKQEAAAKSEEVKAARQQGAALRAQLAKTQGQGTDVQDELATMRVQQVILKRKRERLDAKCAGELLHSHLQSAPIDPLAEGGEQGESPDAPTRPLFSVGHANSSLSCTPLTRTCALRMM